MKKLFIFTLGALMVVTVARAQSGFVQGPSYGTVIRTLPQNFTAGSTPFMVDGTAVTNIAITNTTIIPIGPNGVNIYVHAGGTNALTVTNSSCVFGLVFPGNTNVSTVLRYAFHFPPNGTGRALHATNFSTGVYAANTSPLLNLGNAAGIRLLSITNNNGANEALFITNLVWSAR